MKSALLVAIAIFTSFGASAVDQPSVIPAPQKMELRAGSFDLTEQTRICCDRASRETARFLAARLRQSTGFPLKMTKMPPAGQIPQNVIVLTTNSALVGLGPEGYELTVTASGAAIRAPTQAGLFYGVQTFLQLMPAEIFSPRMAGNVTWQAPCVWIEDWPQFRWRGYMLDVSRHFFTKSEVETLLDGLALHKMNMFHLHLTDDQGWRIEIKKYPKLTRVGAWRPDVGFGFASNSSTAYGPDGRYGGFYTQKDIREVVKYAAARHITIVPEIEMPGHSTAALVAYPEFGCPGSTFSPVMTNGVFHGIYDPAKEQTFTFLGGVIAEVSQLFPGPYIHIGGDEVPKDTWKHSPDCQALILREGLANEEGLQSWFVRRIEKIVNARGKRLIGWSEILQGGLAQNATVMDWIGGAKEATAAGHDVVMTPTRYCYLDFYQSTNYDREPKAAGWSAPLTLRKTYAYKPMADNLSESAQSHILGAQGNLWTEWVPNLKHAEYMTFPRVCALAEDTWTSDAGRNWDDFVRRLQVHLRRLDELNINYRHPENPGSDQ